MQNLHPKIAEELKPLLMELDTAGWKVFSHRYDARSFGNWIVELRRNDHWIEFVKDRSQYRVDGSQIEEIKAAGLWTVFDDLDEFREAVAKFATKPN
jgi:hypothetical protein